MSGPGQLSAGIDCPTSSELHVFLHGAATDDAGVRIETHVSNCQRCMAVVDQLEEHSDVVVRTLAALPASADDEDEFRQLQRELLVLPAVARERSAAHSTAGIGESPTQPHPTTLPHRLGAYELLDEIGRGATGAVYRVRHEKLDRVFAMKVLYQEHCADVDSVNRFMTEMKAVGRLDHPHIVRATDAGEDQGYQYLVMEYSAGLDVSDILRRLGPLSIADACEISRQAVMGLGHAHQFGVIHRDVKPSNLLLTAEGQVKLLDLGLVAVAQAPPAGLVDRYPRGTADYMAPEQWTDYPNVDERADLYSLGCTLFRMLSGSAPFHPLPDEFGSKMTAHLSAEIPRISALRSNVPPELERLVARLLAKRPEERYQNAAALIEDLTPLAKGADLRSLAEQVGLTPRMPHATDARPNAHAPNDRLINRRTVLLGGAAAISLGAIYGRRWFTSVPKVRTDTWRGLAPQASEFLLSWGDRATWSEHNDGSFLIDSNGYSLINLGRPLTTPFSLRTALTLDSRECWAGLFFRYREAVQEVGLVRGFHVIEVSPRSDGNSSQAFLEWGHVVFSESSPDKQVEYTALASTLVELAGSNSRWELSVALGFGGFPGVTWNGKPLPESRWVLTSDGRHKSQMTKERLRTDFMGSLGAFVSSGAATFYRPELMYHEML